MKGREFPIMTHDAARKGLRVVVTGIPWALIATDVGEARAMQNHNQTLARLAERHGLDACEALCILLNQDWSPGDEAMAHRILYAMRVAYRRGQLSILQGFDEHPSVKAAACG